MMGVVVRVMCVNGQDCGVACAENKTEHSDGVELYIHIFSLPFPVLSTFFGTISLPSRRPSVTFDHQLLKDSETLGSTSRRDPQGIVLLSRHTLLYTANASELQLQTTGEALSRSFNRITVHRGA